MIEQAEREAREEDVQRIYLMAMECFGALIWETKQGARRYPIKCRLQVAITGRGELQHEVYLVRVAYRGQSWRSWFDTLEEAMTGLTYLAERAMQSQKADFAERLVSAVFGETTP